MQRTGLVVCGLLAVPGLAQEPPPHPGPPTAYGEYGPPQAVDLSEVAYNSESYQRANVLTKGELRPLGGHLDKFLLVEGTARLLVIPVPELGDGPRQLIGRRLEVTGIVRSLPTQQPTVACRGRLMPETKCADPDLPALPNAQVDWPPISITVLSLSEVASSARGAPEADGLDLQDLVAADTPYAGQTVRVVGLFGGRNLFGDLPQGSARAPSDWVLRQPPHAIWVTGKKPEGKGWKLDPLYKGDGVRWIEVTGRVEVAAGVSFLRASKVLLTSAPKQP